MQGIYFVHGNTPVTKIFSFSLIFKVP
jgi:hypothetical protein